MYVSRNRLPRLRLIYAFRELAEHLSEQGYEGTFIDTQIDFAEKQAASQNAKQCEPEDNIAEPNVLGIENTKESSWGREHKITYSPLQERFPVSPACLRIRKKTLNTDEPIDPLCFASEIILYPAHPSNDHRLAFLKACCDRTDFRSILSSFWLWSQSWGLNQFTPTICAYIVLTFLQVRVKTF